MVNQRRRVSQLPQFLHGAQQVAAHGGGVETVTFADLGGVSAFEKMFAHNLPTQWRQCVQERGEIVFDSRCHRRRRHSAFIQQVQRRGLLGTAFEGVLFPPKCDGRAAGDDGDERAAFIKIGRAGGQLGVSRDGGGGDILDIGRIGQQPARRAAGHGPEMPEGLSPRFFRGGFSRLAHGLVTTV